MGEQTPTDETDRNPPRWSGKDTFIWYVRGGELDGTYYTQHFPILVDDYDGEVVLWHWDSEQEQA